MGTQENDSHGCCIMCVVLVCVGVCVCICLFVYACLYMYYSFTNHWGMAGNRKWLWNHLHLFSQTHTYWGLGFAVSLWINGLRRQKRVNAHDSVTLLMIFWKLPLRTRWNWFNKTSAIYHHIFSSFQTNEALMCVLLTLFFPPVGCYHSQVCCTFLESVLTAIRASSHPRNMRWDVWITPGCDMSQKLKRKGWEQRGESHTETVRVKDTTSQLQ